MLIVLGTLSVTHTCTRVMYTIQVNNMHVHLDRLTRGHLDRLTTCTYLDRLTTRVHMDRLTTSSVCTFTG